LLFTTFLELSGYFLILSRYSFPGYGFLFQEETRQDLVLDHIGTGDFIPGESFGLRVFSLSVINASWHF